MRSEKRLRPARSSDLRFCRGVIVSLVKGRPYPRPHPTIRILILCLLSLWAFSAHAQEGDEPDNLVVYGEVTTGQIGNSTPQATYVFDALRCDFLSVRLRATDGNLDPVLVILDSQESPILVQDDSRGSRDVVIEPLNIPASGRYTLVVGRFGYGVGSTSGAYQLTIDRIGNGSAHGCALRYGDTVYNGITNMQSQLIYSFRARQGDIVNISMQRRTGDLDPYLMVTDNAGFVLADNDDIFGGGTDSLIENLLIPVDGTYYIFATRYGLEAGSTTGNFLLTLDESAASGLGNSPRAAIPLGYNLALENIISDEHYEQYYRFEARQYDIISARMTRQDGDIDAFLVIANTDLQELVFNDDSDGSQNSAIEDFLIPADGTYFLIATRYEREAGTTTGRYRIELQSEGNAFADVPSDVRRINYGTTVTGSIDDVTPEVYYAFWGVEGDALTLAMNRGDGDLDPYVSILAEDQRTELISDDDGGNAQNALIERYEIPRTGVYYIRAGRFKGQENPNTSGSYILVLAQRFD